MTAPAFGQEVQTVRGQGLGILERRELFEDFLRESHGFIEGDDFGMCPQNLFQEGSATAGMSAEKGDPLGQMKLSSRAKAQAVQRDATALLTACGLALRSFD